MIARGWRRGKKKLSQKRLLVHSFIDVISARGWFDDRAYEIQQELARVSVYYMTVYDLQLRFDLHVMPGQLQNISRTIS